jgi:hypothetical protein
MITVTYLPSGERGPFPDGATEGVFNTHAEFKAWVKAYVCEHCLVDFEELTGRNATSIGDYMAMGCGCEVDVEDPNNLIDWDDTYES